MIGLTRLRPLARVRFVRPTTTPLAPFVQNRNLRYQPYEAAFDSEQLSEARKWHQSFNLSSIPRGETSFSRSSGPGGQHVNKTETKATTSWPVSQLVAILPRFLHSDIRESKYYSRRSDSITVQAQTQRSREANAEENRQKLFDELQRLYNEKVPNESSSEKKQKHQNLEKAFHETRIKIKKQQSSKKLYRRGSSED